MTSQSSCHGSMEVPGAVLLDISGIDISDEQMEVICIAGCFGGVLMGDRRMVGDGQPRSAAGWPNDAGVTPDARLLAEWDAMGPGGCHYRTEHTSQVLRVADLMRYVEADVYHRDYGCWDLPGDRNKPDVRSIDGCHRKCGMGQLV